MLSTTVQCLRPLLKITQRHKYAKPFRPYLHNRAANFSTFDVVVPSLGDSISEGTVVEIVKDAGDACLVDDVLIVIETDKVSVDVRSSVEGVVTTVHVAEEETVRVGTPLCQITEEKFGNMSPANVPVEVAQPSNEGTETEEVCKPPGETPVVKCRGESRVKISRMRMRIAERLKASQNTTAMLTTFNEIDMTNAIQLRKRYKDRFEEKHSVKLGFMSLFAKASAEALTEIPAVNAVIDDSTKEIIYREYIDISVAVASPRGLVVPVLRDVKSMSFLDVETSISEYAVKAKNDQISMEDMSGGTFTISNGGVFGSMLGTPIINPPQSAILGMHGIKQRAVVVADEIKARPIMYVALTYDHRLIDGREAVTFLKSVCNKVEDPTRLLLDL